jgi:hypothetical protein
LREDEKEVMVERVVEALIVVRCDRYVRVRKAGTPNRLGAA